MVTLKAFFDDSGSDAQSPIFVVGGYISTVEMWSRLSEEWCRIVAREGFSFFHMTDAESGNGEFRYLKGDVARRHALIREFASLVENHTLCGIGAGLSRPTWDKTVAMAIAAEPGLIRKVGVPYEILFTQIFRGVREQCERYGASPAETEIVFAKQAGMESRSKRMAKSVCDFAGFPEPTFGEMVELPPLQAADMFAWWLRRSLKDKSASIADRHQPLRRNLAFAPIPASALSRMAIQILQAIDEADRTFGMPESPQQKPGGKPRNE